MTEDLQSSFLFTFRVRKVRAKPLNRQDARIAKKIKALTPTPDNFLASLASWRFRFFRISTFGFSSMAANLTPQYLEAEAEYKKAQTPEDRLACLKKMYTLLPKHKASEKLQADLKTKMSDLRDEVEQAKKSPKKVGVSHKIPKQGAGQYVIVGGPNAGKSRLLSRLTRATPE